MRPRPLDVITVYFCLDFELLSEMGLSIADLFHICQASFQSRLIVIAPLRWCIT